ncbi:MAG TPA: hypothetical protein DEQ84_06245 [Prevotellaceae bacterium]|nr:hypothetical protein [Prevotellaceae bacterium]
MSNLVIIGISDTADRIIRFVNRYCLFNVIGCAVDKSYLPENESIEIGGGYYRVWDLEHLDEHIDADNDYVFVALLWNRLNADRRFLFEKVQQMNRFKFANIISPNAIVRGEIKGVNCWVCDNVIIQEQTVVEDDVFVMDKAFVGHRSIVKSHSFLAAGAMVMGSVIVGEQSYIGVNASIFDGTHIGNKCLVGACTYVKRNLPDFSTIKTPSDAFVIKTYSETEIENKWLARKNVR